MGVQRNPAGGGLDLRLPPWLRVEHIGLESVAGPHLPVLKSRLSALGAPSKVEAEEQSCAKPL
jgi:hypothetical protein